MKVIIESKATGEVKEVDQSLVSQMCGYQKPWKLSSERKLRAYKKRNKHAANAVA